MVQNIEIVFTAAGNFKGAEAAVDDLIGKFAILDGQMQRMSTAKGPTPEQFRRAGTQVDMFSRNMADAAAATGQFEVNQLRLNSAVDEYTVKLQKQQVGLRSMLKDRTMLNAVLKEQYRLQSMTMYITGTDTQGRSLATTLIPKGAVDETQHLLTNMTMLRAMTASASQQMINWGKNTQWAGRQLMVGLSVPLAAFAASAGVMAYKANQGLTDIAKVYNTTAVGVEGRTKELANVSQAAMNTASHAADNYGSSLSDTLDVEAQLAAVGKTGSALQSATTQVMRLSTLGQMDYNTALQSTIALQSIFKMNSDQLTKTINYMNSVENQTSLSMQDFAQAIPIAAAPVKAMGGDIKTLGTLLVAMKANGIPATQAANAIKSSMQRMLNPSKAVIDLFQKLTGQSLPEMIRSTNGQIIPMFQKLYDAVSGLDQLSKEQILVKLFGTQQSTRLSAILNSMQDLRDGVGQVSEAEKIAGENQAKLAQVAQTEITRQMSSTSGQIKKMIAQIKVQLAEMGTSFLTVFKYVGEFAVKLIKTFNGMPTVIKDMVAFGAITIGLVGPLIMLIGLSLNFMGNIGKAASMLIGFGANVVKYMGKATGSTALYTRGQKAAELSSELMQKAMGREAATANSLAESLATVAQALEAEARAADAAYLSTASHVDPNVTRAIAEKTYVETPVAPYAGRHVAVSPEEAANASKLDEHMANIKKSMSAAAVSGGVFMAAMTASMFSSNRIVDDLAKWSMLLSMAVPMVISISKALTAERLAAGWSKASSAITSFATNAGGSIKNIGKLLTTSAGKAGLIGAGIAVAVTVATVLYQRMQDWTKEMEKTYTDTQDLGRLFGYQATSLDHVIKRQKAVTDELAAQVTLADKYNASYSDSVKLIQQAGGDLSTFAQRQAAFQQASSVGAMVIASGGSVENAKKAVLTALTAAEGVVGAHKLMLEFGYDPKSPERVVNQYLQTVRTDLNKENQSNPWWSMFSLGGNRAAAAAQNAGKMLALALQQGINANAPKLTTEAFNEIFARLKTGSVNNPFGGQSLTTFIALGHQMGLTDDAAIKLWGDYKKGSASAVDVINELGYKMTVAMKIQALLAQKNAGNWNAADQAQLTHLQNQQKVIEHNAAIDRQVAAIGARLERNQQDIANQNNSLEAQNQLYEHQQKIFSAFKFVDTMKSTMQSAQQDIASQVSNDFQTKMNNALQAMQNAAQAKMDAFDKMVQARDDKYQQQEQALQNEQQKQTNQFQAMWQHREDVVTKTYDARIAAVQKSIDAEQHAEAIREQIYNAEINRIQRLADLQNNQIQMNADIASGNLDAAAQIKNTMQADQQTNAMQDAEDAAQRRSQSIQDRLNKQMDQLRQVQQDRLDAMKKLETAEENALQRQQQREQDALKAEQDRYDKTMALRRDAMQKSIDYAQQAAQAEWNARQDVLNREIQAYEAYIPTSLADLQRWTQQTGQRYDEFGNVLKQKGAAWSQIIGTDLDREIHLSAMGLKTDIAWGQIGRAAALQMVESAFGMNLLQFQKWAGMIPKPPPGQQQYHHMGGLGMPIYHTGGPVGGEFGGPGLKPNEQMAILKRGEYVVNDKTHGMVGTDFLNRLAKAEGGPGDIHMGMPGLIGAALARGAVNTLLNTVMARVSPALSGFMPGSAGVYGNSGVFFGSDQLRNAAIIASVGKSLGASTRDIIVALMTAMQESGLRNLTYGDLDSVGLFQQRAAWGSFDQRTNPVDAASMFFMGGHGGQRGLLDIPNRNDMTYAQEAQAVQVSAYPSAYAKWFDEATAIFRSLVMGLQGFVQGPGGWHSPMPGHHVTNPFGNGHWGVDFAVPVGTPVRAAASGKISASYDIPGPLPTDKYHNPAYGPYGSYGRVIHLDTPLSTGGFLRTLYAHNSQRLVNAGRYVKGGSTIAMSGGTGNASGPHLHFETDPNGQYPGVDPVAYMARHGVYLRNGGVVKYDNTPAILHANETVLTSKLSDQMQKGLQKLATGDTNTNQYHFQLDVHPSPGMDEKQFADAVVNVIERRIESTGRSRRITDR